MDTKSSGRIKLRRLLWTDERRAIRILKDIDVDPYGIEAMLPKMAHLNILIRRLPCKVANIIKQEMLSVGADAAVARGTVACSIEATDVLLMATPKQIERFIEKLSSQPFGLSQLAVSIGQLLENIGRDQWTLSTGRRKMVLGDRTLIMAILNVTPDSFSDGGCFFPREKAVAAGIGLAAAGADILDIGGESSRPGAETVSAEEELSRVIPVIEGLSGKVDIPISVDTTKAVVAREALAAGAEIINDISSMRFDAQMPEVMASSGAAVVFMHMRGVPESMQQGDLHYASLTGEIIDFFHDRLNAAQAAGISAERIILDPGLGFGKSRSDNLKLLRYLAEFSVLGRPILTGPSRKSFLSHDGEAGPQDRLEGTLAAVTAAIMNGSHLVRVHDVDAVRRAVAIADAIIRA
ncbi:MAG: dihydropteroate synthase [Syntrophus sp. (in: bacteria)]|nr:dihydropteroate synthase [Syntrophus sp. (in: bacteria)]